MPDTHHTRQPLECVLPRPQLTWAEEGSAWRAVAWIEASTGSRPDLTQASSGGRLPRGERDLWSELYLDKLSAADLKLSLLNYSLSDARDM